MLQQAKMIVDTPLGCVIINLVKTNVQRLNNIVGQVEGVKRMLSEGQDCVKILTQLKAIKSAVSGVMDSVVEGQFDNCMKSIKKEDKDLLIKIKDYVKTN